MTSKGRYRSEKKEVNFIDRLQLLVWLVAINLTFLLYAFTVLISSPLPDSQLDFAIFVSITVLIPIMTALVLRWIQPASVNNPRNELIVYSSMSIIIATAILLVVLALFMWLFSIPAYALQVSKKIMIFGLTAIHFILSIAIILLPQNTINAVTNIKYISELPCNRLEFYSVFSIIVLAAMFILFRIEPENSLSYVIFGLVAGLLSKPGFIVLILSSVFSLLVIIICFRLLRFEDMYMSIKPDKLSRIQSAALYITIIAIFCFYFDFTFESDVLHFLTNVGPAIQIMYGDGIPMIDTFSQYGQGPIYATWIGFLIGSPSFSSANIVAQLASLLFYVVITVCLFRMSKYRLSALFLGFFIIGMMLAGWWGGNYSLNTVPSAMGLRYLPTALVVLAFSFLKERQKFSIFLFIVLCLSVLWSFEALIGSVAIAGLFYLIYAVSLRSLSELIVSIVVGLVFPITIGLSINVLITLFWSGKIPDFATYLEFAKIYNFTSEFWAIPHRGTFMGWIPVAVVVMTAISLAWFSALNTKYVEFNWKHQLLLYRILPMAGLTAYMSSYFVGRSVDFTLIISFLPLCALLIPVFLAVFREALVNNNSQYRYLAVVPVFVLFIALSFSFTVLYRADGPYSTLVNQCFQHGNCAPNSLANSLKRQISLQPMLDQEANPNYFDTTGLAQEALNLIKNYELKRKKIALFLGIHPTTDWSVHTNTVLLLSGKAHRWPISYVLSDEVNPRRFTQILAAKIQLDEGETVFVRKDEKLLGKLEQAILEKIRSVVRLCPLPISGEMVVAYRVSKNKTC